MKYILYTTNCILLIFTIVGCSVLKSNKSNTLLFELETTSCYGTCPVYKLRVYDSGYATLEGIENLDKIGTYNSTISKEKLQKISQSFEDISFFELQDSYRSQFKDLPTKYITYYKNGKSKQIMGYDNIPKKLDMLIKDIEQLVKELDWQK